MVSILESGLPGIEVPPGATITSRSAVRIRINFWRMVGLYNQLWEIEPMHLSVEGLRPWDWSYCSISWSNPLIFDMALLLNPVLDSSGGGGLTPGASQPPPPPT